MNSNRRETEEHMREFKRKFRLSERERRRKFRLSEQERRRKFRPNSGIDAWQTCWQLICACIVLTGSLYMLIRLSS